MRISIDIDDNEPIYTIIDSIVLGYLKNSLALVNDRAYKPTHPDDIEADIKVKEAFLELIEYYGG